MKIKDLIKKKGNEVFTIEDNSIICNVLKVMIEKKIGILVAMKDDKISGLISERDILYKIYNKNGNIKNSKVEEIMTPKEKIIFGSMEDDIEDIMEKMTRNKIRHIPIITDSELKGIVSIGDIVKVLYDLANHEKKVLQDYISSPY